jgi:hypothetical protein
MAGDIKSERWARSFRNGGRHRAESARALSSAPIGRQRNPFLIAWAHLERVIFWWSLAVSTRAIAGLNPAAAFSYVPIIEACACNAKPLIGQNQLMKLHVCVGRANEILEMWGARWRSRSK